MPKKERHGHFNFIWFVFHSRRLTVYSFDLFFFFFSVLFSLRGIPHSGRACSQSGVKIKVHCDGRHQMTSNKRIMELIGMKVS